MPGLLRRLAAAAVAVVAVAAAAVAVLLASGQIAVVATHGVSMNPVYYQGDLVVVVRSDTYAVGDIVAYHVHGGPVVALHRIIAGNADGFTVKGDNNQSTDIDHPTAAQVLGRAVVHIPQAGTVLKAVASPPFLAVAAVALLGGGTTALGRHRRRRARRRTSNMSRHLVPASRPRPGTLAGMLERPVRGWTAGAAAALALSAALGVWAWSAPAGSNGATASGQGEQLSFSYTAPVRASAAYDGTSVSSPDPVFRKVLAGNVAVGYTYRGNPGTVAVAAELSTPGGWHTTIPLQDATKVGADYKGTVQLDLAALEARAQAAAQATGTPGTPITVAVVPTVHTAGSGDFAPALRLTLDPLALRLADSSSLTAQTPAASAVPATQRRLSLGAWSLVASTARPLSAGVFAAALLALAALAVASRRHRPVGETERIRSRWGSLLVPVQPMTTPPGRSVVDVADFATLARLAERYGLLVLHWSRSGVETFLVNDEGTAYRYRTGSTSAFAPASAEPAETSSTVGP